MKVFFDDQPLTQPYVLVVKVAARGRQDISKGDFEDGPLILDVGEFIRDVLEVSSKPTWGPTPKVVAEERTLHIGPALIRRRQTIFISVLIEGGSPRLSRPAGTIANVRVQPGRRFQRRDFAWPSSARLRDPRTVMIAALAILLVLFGLAAASTRSPGLMFDGGIEASQIGSLPGR
ncbi:MAG TPA: hypothetical protein VGX23_25645 [Actinocrinis sp.]|nr:hypothetical protein [Actinocrinis sp.]